MKTTKALPTKRVRAIYEDSAVQFDLPEDATLEQLAAMLAVAGRGHGDPVEVEVGHVQVAIDPPR